MTALSNPALKQDAETHYYLRVTLIVTAGMLVGGLFEWFPQEPSPWRWLPLALVYLVGGYVIHLGKRARRIVRQNTIFSVGWMLFLVMVTLTVGMPLTLAVVAHEGSTLLVAINGLRLLVGRPHPPTVPARC